MLAHGRTPVDDVDLPANAKGATVRDVTWFDARGRITEDSSKIAETVIVYRDDADQPIITVYGAPFDDA
ncbi:MAG: hypothetical protein ABR616_18300 [Dermatophilaceae bacterium]